MRSPMKQSKPLRRLGIVLVALVFLFGLMTATARERSEVTVVEKSVATILYPFQVGTYWMAERVRGFGSAIAELTRLREENQSLREQVRASAQADARNQILEHENQLLEMELQMKKRSPYPLLTARVISRTPDNWYRTVVIDRGSRDHIRPNMAVINWQGLVGKVTHTTPFTATVQLVLDAGFGQGGFGAGSKLPTGELGVIETLQGDHVRMRFFSSQPAVQVGHPVYTSGQAVLPADLLIGYVESPGSSDSAFDQFVVVRPSVDFDKLGVVHVVLQTADQEKEADTP